MSHSRRTIGLLFAASSALLVFTSSAKAYIEAAYTLGRLVQESTNIILARVEKTDTERNLIIFRKVQDIKGTNPDVFKHDIGRGGFNPREWQFIMAAAQPGRTAVIMHNTSASETCVDNYWYQCYPGGEWWKMNHGEPYLLRSFAGKPEKLAALITAMMAGQEVIAPCMQDGDKNALQLRTARMQRMKASMKLQDYDQKRDFVGWGNEEFRRINSMPGFAQYGAIGRVDPAAHGIAAADFNGDGQIDLCLWGEEKVLLLQNGGSAFEEVTLPCSGGARAASWGDYNGDGKVDLLLATPSGPRLFTNEGGKFRDDSAVLPKEPYYNVTAAAWIDYNGDGKLDILLANGFLGLRLYACKAAAPGASAAFEDVSDRVGLGFMGLASHLKGDHLAVADVNGDGRPDFLYSAGTGLLAMNTPQGFVAANGCGVTYQCGKVAPVFGDANGDGFLDLFVPQASGCKLFRNDGKGHFADVTAQSGDLAGLKACATSAAFADFSKTGRSDLLVGCLRGANRYFRNNGNGTFTDAGEELGLYQKIFNTRALCVADLNKDGVPDLVMNNEGQDSAILLSAAGRIKK